MRDVDRPNHLALRVFGEAKLAGVSAAQRATAGVDGGLGRGVALGVAAVIMVVHDEES